MQYRFRNFVVTLMAPLAMLTAACGDDINIRLGQETDVNSPPGSTPSGSSVASVTFDPPGPYSGDNCVGQNTMQLKVVANLREGGQVLATSIVTYVVRDGNVASVSSSGLLTRLAAGRTWVVATYPNTSVQDSVEVIVTDCPNPPAELQLTPSGPQTLACSATLTISSNMTGTWQNSHSAYASINTTGPSSSVVVTGLANGQTTITQTSGGQSRSVIVTVNCATPPPPQRVLSVTVVPSILNLVFSQRDSATLVVDTENGAPQTVTVNNPDPSCATVTMVGQRIYAVANNRVCSVEVKYTSTFDPARYDFLRINVTSGATQIVLNPSTPQNLACGATLTINSNQSGTWSNSQPSVANISTTGPSSSVVVTGLANGQTTITQTNGTYSQGVTITVNCGAPTISVVVNPNPFTGTAGSQTNFTATVTGTSNTSGTWSLANPNCGTISANGTNATVAWAMACSNLAVRFTLSSGQFGSATGNVGSGNVVCSYSSSTGQNSDGTIPISKDETAVLTGSCVNQYGTAFIPYWRSNHPEVVTVLGATTTIVVDGVTYHAGPQATIKGRGIKDQEAIITMQASITDKTALVQRTVKIR